jgi:hypothetical protein
MLQSCENRPAEGQTDPRAPQAPSWPVLPAQLALAALPGEQGPAGPVWRCVGLYAEELDPCGEHLGNYRKPSPT